MPPRLLIFGRNGQVARALAQEAKTQGFSVSFLGRNELDLGTATDQAITTAIDAATPDFVINAAAYTAVDNAETDEKAAFTLNCSAPEMIAKACAARATPLLHISTDYVFDGQKPKPYKEDDPVNPASVYGASKQAGEAAIRAAGGPHIILRAAWVYSPFGSNFVKTMLRLGATHEEVSIVADQRGCPTSAAEIAAALLSLCRTLDSKQGPYGTYHFCGNTPLTWYDFAEIIFAKAAALGAKVPTKVSPITTEHYPTPATRPANSVLDCTKIKHAFGITPPAFEDMLNACLKELTQTP